ncbi:MAG TPA: hypothetical protein IAA98_08115 [Candidatus Avipropionibacterium avicola]|uniref:Uncharacterized protein n=1 Tax=Candidatus Avipropionibacterium avicola TaxID=2840701 RepID=A0A9D1GXY8_9ACTN|nr:hypothetical protein [Candidatus Avipropionibacterium avicola]
MSGPGLRKRRVSAPSGLSLVAGLVFVIIAAATLGTLAWGLWWQVAKIAAPLTLVFCGVVGIVWSQRRSRPTRPPH